MAMAIHASLGGLDHVVELVEPLNVEDSAHKSFANLVKRMQSGQIDHLVVMDCNPYFTSAGDSGFREALSKVKNIIHLTESPNETSVLASWQLPLSHFLESWADVRDLRNTTSVVQPLIAPLSDSRSLVEMAEFFATGQMQSGYELVRSTWRKTLSGGNFENRWRQVLHDGVRGEDGLKNKVSGARVRTDNITRSLRFLPLSKDVAAADSLEVVFTPSPAIFDGRFANNAWLQELPDPITKLTWGNAALISPALAKNLGLENEDVVELSHADNRSEKLSLPVWQVPGLAKYTVVLPAGYGRTRAGKVGDGVGVDVYPLRRSANLHYDLGYSLQKTGKKFELATTQLHGSMEGRPIIREASLKEYEKHPEFAKHQEEHPPLKSLFKEPDYSKGPQWGMSIDLTACTGCGTCAIACQSENNIPVVGKEQVRLGREMNWIRVDRYFSGDTDNPSVAHQPVACQHCENAPCEQVCPVAATVHDEEGLNVMTYNRCIGTRYCANNCPYKVRRFNFFNFTNKTPEIVKMANNPDVTVRSRGVMEKCSFCLQRINAAKISAKLEKRELDDGDVKTACQQACPTEAIRFGDITDSNSRVAQAKKVDRNYELLGFLNVKPRNSYLAKIRNMNSKLDEA